MPINFIDRRVDLGDESEGVRSSAAEFQHKADKGLLDPQNWPASKDNDRGGRAIGAFAPRNLVSSGRYQRGRQRTGFLRDITEVEEAF